MQHKYRKKTPTNYTMLLNYSKDVSGHIVVKVSMKNNRKLRSSIKLLVYPKIYEVGKLISFYFFVFFCFFTSLKVKTLNQT